jgi:hypothetical protein
MPPPLIKSTWFAQEKVKPTRVRFTRIMARKWVKIIERHEVGYRVELEKGYEFNPPNKSPTERFYVSLEEAHAKNQPQIYYVCKRSSRMKNIVILGLALAIYKYATRSRRGDHLYYVRYGK